MSKPTPIHHAFTSDSPRIALAGWGLLTPLGLGAWATFLALLQGRTLRDRAATLPEDTAPVDLARALGGVVAVQHTRADPGIELAERAVREAVTMAGVELRDLPLYLGTSKGAIAKLSTHLGMDRPITEDIAACLALGPHAYMSGELARRLGTSARSHHVAACSSGLVALDAARRALLHQSPDASPYAIVASADAAITPAMVHSYRRLGVLGDMTAQTYTQRPLDAQRAGFMLSEIGAAVLLKRIEPGETMPANSIELASTATACEPYDIVRSPDDMRSLGRLWQSATSGLQVDVIHPHAPGTREHDPAEVRALLHAESFLPAEPHAEHTPDLYAVKGAIGHGLGASGLASLVVAAMCLRSGKRPPMPWIREPMRLPDDTPIPIISDARSCSTTGVHGVLAAGFGGHLAAAILLGHGRGKTPREPSTPQR
jgi:3-oxoacyl-(acyl-carrier-protein) synthase